MAIIMMMRKKKWTSKNISTSISMNINMSINKITVISMMIRKSSLARENQLLKGVKMSRRDSIIKVTIIKKIIHINMIKILESLLIMMYKINN